MKYTEEMILHSDSGYCMPFEEPRGKDVELSLGYGEQVHPTTGEKFFHHGIDFKARYYILSAVASEASRLRSNSRRLTSPVSISWLACQDRLAKY